MNDHYKYLKYKTKYLNSLGKLNNSPHKEEGLIGGKKKNKHRIVGGNEQHITDFLRKSHQNYPQ